MARVIKKDNEYFVEYWAQGLRFLKKGGADESHAQKLLDEINASVPLRIEDIYTVREDTLDAAVEVFSKYAYDNLPAKINRRVTISLKHFCAFVDQKCGSQVKIFKITPKILNQYYVSLKDIQAERPDHLSKVIDINLYLLRLFFDWVVSFGALNDNPTMHLNILKPETYRTPKVLSTEDLNELFARQNNDNEKLTVRLMLSTGLSLNELKKIKLKNFDFESNTLTYNNRQWPLDSSVLIYKSLLLAGISFDAVQTPKNYLIRNTFAQNLLNRGVSLLQLTAYLGFDDIIKVMPYSVFMPQYELN